LGIRIDLHVHTSRYSPCSRIDPARLVNQAQRAGLDGLVITEHNRQWPQEELDELVTRSQAPGFILFSGLEYTSTQGDVLIYGLTPEQADVFQPGLEPEEVVHRVADLGGLCVAAHPTRAGAGFDERILNIPFAALEVASATMKEHEQRLAARLAAGMGIPGVAASDAHLAKEIGACCTEFDAAVRSAKDLHDALRSGRFRCVNRSEPRT